MTSSGTSLPNRRPCIVVWGSVWHLGYIDHQDDGPSINFGRPTAEAFDTPVQFACGGVATFDEGLAWSSGLEYPLSFVILGNDKFCGVCFSFITDTRYLA